MGKFARERLGNPLSEERIPSKTRRNRGKINIQLHPEIFTFIKIPDGIVDIRNFQTTEIVANECGCLFYALRSGRLDIWGQRVQMKEEY